ncbi:MAG: hypothetical protein D6766_11780, partial [Verrucomicrobia bacterium]
KWGVMPGQPERPAGKGDPMARVGSPVRLRLLIPEAEWHSSTWRMGMHAPRCRDGDSPPVGGFRWGRTRGGSRSGPRSRLGVVLGMVVLVGVGRPLRVRTADAPHDFNCLDCHQTHYLNGNPFTSIEGAANVCLSCHQPGGLASAHGWTAGEQAELWAGLPEQLAERGRSHRWDAGPTGRVVALGAAPPEAIRPGGDYQGRYPRTYRITITAGGALGEATFAWEGSGPDGGAGSGVTAAGAALDEGVTVDFAERTYRPGEAWELRVRPDLAEPTAPELLAKMHEGRMTCSTCHNQHSQAHDPFDPDAPASGEGRHLMRIDNAVCQLCQECHGARFVTESAAGSHPVGVAVPGTDRFHEPASLPLDAVEGKVRCLTCHQMHDAPADDGRLLRMARQNDLCAECHATVDVATPALHLDPVNGPLWPGGKHGSTKPADPDPEHRGACSNCHRVHGWPDAADPAADYPTLLVEREENLCYTCHDGTGPGSDVLASFRQRYTHPVNISGRHQPRESDGAAFGTANRHAECVDCHNPHRLTAATGPVVAPSASPANQGVSRVAVSYAGVGQASYLFKDETAPGEVREYELCFKCHSGWTTQPAGQEDLALKLNPRNPSYHPVMAAGKNTNIRAGAFVNGWRGTSLTLCSDCHGSNNPSLPGVHGSDFPHLLQASYTPSSSKRTMSRTELCFRCHNYDTYANRSASNTVKGYSRFNPPAFKKGHTFHVGEKRYPCYACHETHGSTTRPHLIVTGRSPGIRTYSETSTGGSCNPSCHGNKTYKINYSR